MPSKNPDGSSSAAGSSEGPPGNVINLNALTLQQLTQLKQQVEQELNFYQDSLLQLKDVQNKMQESGVCLKQFVSSNKKDVLVPVTGSMFVRGEIEDPDHVLVDIGTGYYVEKTIDEGTEYLKRKVEFLTSHIEKVQGIGREKFQVRAAIQEVLDGKIQSQVAAQQQAKKGIATK